MAEMEIALAAYFNYRTNLIVPNVSWGMFLHECDLLIITKAGYAWEIEIKTSKYDLVRDKEKRHNHTSNKIKHLYFAIPDYLLVHQVHIPNFAGIVSVHRYNNGLLTCKKIREAKIKSKYKFTIEERYQVARLGSMRIWKLKNKLLTERRGNVIGHDLVGVSINKDNT